MIYDLLRTYHRARRYRQVSALITEAMTRESLERVDKTLVDAYSKATAQGASLEDAKKFDQSLIDKVNNVLSRENAIRVRQWTEAILAEEENAL